MTAEREPAAFGTQTDQQTSADLDVVAAIAERYVYDAHAPRIRFAPVVSKVCRVQAERAARQLSG
jgi:hypothetical protein